MINSSVGKPPTVRPRLALSLEGAGNCPLNGEITNEFTGAEESPYDELIRTDVVRENLSHQSSKIFDFEANPAYGTDVAIAPEIATSDNIAYETGESTMSQYIPIL